MGLDFMFLKRKDCFAFGHLWIPNKYLLTNWMSEWTIDMQVHVFSPLHQIPQQKAEWNCRHLSRLCLGFTLGILVVSVEHNDILATCFSLYQSTYGFSPAFVLIQGNQNWL